MSDNYYKLVTVIVQHCPKVLRETVLKYAQQEDPTFTSIYSFLLNKKATLDFLKRRQKLLEHQYDMIINNVDIKLWDVSMLCALLLGVFKRKLQTNEISAIGIIKTTRNNLHHKATTANVTDLEFTNTWNSLKDCILRLARQSNKPDLETKMKLQLKHTKQIWVSPVVESIRSWYTQCMDCRLEKQRVQLIKLHTASRGIKRVAEHSVNLLEAVIIEDEGSSSKRVRIENERLERLRHEFQLTMKENLPGDYVPKRETIDKIKSALQLHHRLVVMGHGSGLQLKMALAAINELDVNSNECAEMIDANDWASVDLREISVILFRDPFGEVSFDANKAKSFQKKFNSIKQATDNMELNLHFIVVSPIDVMKEAFEQGFSHAMFQPQVEVLEIKDNAEVIIHDDQIDHKDPILKNLLDMTNVYLHQQLDVSVDLELLKKCSDTLKRHRTLVVIGPNTQARTAVIVNLASKYPGRCLLLTNPDDFRHVQLDIISLLVIEDFTGKYKMDESKMCKWLENFDMLNALATERKLRVIITSRERILGVERGKTKVPKHRLLLHKVSLGSKHVSGISKPTKAETLHTSPCRVLLERCSAESELEINPHTNIDERPTGTIAHKFIGRQIKQWWEDDRRWYNGIVHALVSGQDGDDEAEYEVFYDDGSNYIVRGLVEDFRMKTVEDIGEVPTFVGKRIKHLWKSKNGTPQWYFGTVYKLLTGRDGYIGADYQVNYDEFKGQVYTTNKLIKDYIQGCVIFVPDTFYPLTRHACSSIPNTEHKYAS